MQLKGGGCGADFDAIFDARVKEADEFYASVMQLCYDEDDRRIMRQALAGMLWSKQFYYFDLDLWLREHGYNATGAERERRRCAMLRGSTC